MYVEGDEVIKASSSEKLETGTMSPVGVTLYVIVWLPLIVVTYGVLAV